MNRHILFRSILVILVLFACYKVFIIKKQETVRHRPPEPLLQATPNTLKLGDNAPEEFIVPLNSPMEFDGKTRHEVLLLRKQAMDALPGLIQGEYISFGAPFYRIVDGKPWYGLEGQFCYDRGTRSIEGPSEESRFLLNPFILLGLDYAGGFATIGYPCDPLYPKITSLRWMPREYKAQITYDMTRYFVGRANFPDFPGDYHIMSFEASNFNARDFGFQYVSADLNASSNVEATANAKLFEAAIPLRSYIDIGHSCQYPGGCNNGSAFETHFRFRIKELPATIHCKLWKQKPSSPKDAADFTYIMIFE